MTERSGSFRIYLAAALLSAMALPALATFTTVGSPAGSEASHEGIFEGVYGGDFVGSGIDLGNGLWTVFSNGTVTATRVDDDGFVTLLDLYGGFAGSGDDDLWTDGTTTAVAEARFAGKSQEFGYDEGLGFVKLFDVSGSGFGVSGSGMVTFAAGAMWEWARADDSDAGLSNPHYSEESSNTDGLDHMVTYHVTGITGVPSTTNVWAVFFEDVSGTGSDRDFNDLMVQLSVVECVTDDDCDDGLTCTIDTCDTDTSVCVFTPVDCTAFDNACQIFSCDPNGAVGNCDIATDRTDCSQFDDACQTFSCDLNGVVGNCDTATDRTDCSQFDTACETFSCDLNGAEGNCDTSTPTVDCSANDTNCETFACDPNGATGNCDIATPTVDCSVNDNACQTFACDPVNGAVGNCDIATDRTDCSQFDDACQTFSCDLNGAVGNCDTATDRTDCSQFDTACETFSCDLNGAEGNCDTSTPTVDCSENDNACQTFACDPNGATGNCDIATDRTDCSQFDDACQTFSCDLNGEEGNCDVATDRTDCDAMNTHCEEYACDPGGAVGNCSAVTLRCGACCLPDGSCVHDVRPTECVGLGGDFINLGVLCLGDNDGDGHDDICPPPAVIPTVSEWGLIVMALLGLAMGTVMFGRRRHAVAS